MLNYRVAVAGKLLEEVSQIQPSTNLADSTVAEQNLETQFVRPEANDDKVDSVPDVVASRGPVQSRIESIADIWPTTSLMAFNRAAHVALRDTENPGAYADFMESDEVSNLKAAWESFEESEKHCPFLYRTQFRLAQLSIVKDQGRSQRDRIQQAIGRCRINANLLYNAGLLEHHARDSGTAAIYWGQVMKLTRKYDPQIILYSRYELSMRDFFEVILPREPILLMAIADKYFGSVDDQLPRKLLLNHLRRLLLENSPELDRPEHQFLLGKIESEFGRFSTSNRHYENALAHRNDQVAWRLEYAKSLFRQGNHSESSKNLKICLLQPGRTGPQTRQVQDLLRRIERQ